MLSHEIKILIFLVIFMFIFSHAHAEENSLSGKVRYLCEGNKHLTFHKNSKGRKFLSVGFGGFLKSKMNPETGELEDEEKDVTTYCWFDGIRLTDIFTDKLFHASGNKNISFYAGFKEHCSEGQTMIFNTKNEKLIQVDSFSMKATVLDCHLEKE